MYSLQVLSPGKEKGLSFMPDEAEARLSRALTKTGKLTRFAEQGCSQKMRPAGAAKQDKAGRASV